MKQKKDREIEILNHALYALHRTTGKAVDRAVALAAVKNRLEPYDRKGVLVAPSVTAEFAQHCRDSIRAGSGLPTAAGGNRHVSPTGRAGAVRSRRPS